MAPYSPIAMADPNPIGL